jgi:hypothetical protein
MFQNVKKKTMFLGPQGSADQQEWLWKAKWCWYRRVIHYAPVPPETGIAPLGERYLLHGLVVLELVGVEYRPADALDQLAGEVVGFEVGGGDALAIDDRVVGVLRLVGDYEDLRHRVSSRLDSEGKDGRRP